MCIKILCSEPVATPFYDVMHFTEHLVHQIEKYVTSSIFIMFKIYHDDVDWKMIRLLFIHNYKILLYDPTFWYFVDVLLHFTANNIQFYIKGVLNMSVFCVHVNVRQCLFEHVCVWVECIWLWIWIFGARNIKWRLVYF